MNKPPSGARATQIAFLKALEALALAAEDVERNPTREILLMAEARDRESSADWEGAERILQEILALVGAEGNEGCIAKALEGFGDALNAIGRTQEAESAHQEGRALRRRIESGVGLGGIDPAGGRRA
jgi:hypothetical protein